MPRYTKLEIVRRRGSAARFQDMSQDPAVSMFFPSTTLMTSTVLLSSILAGLWSIPVSAQDGRSGAGDQQQIRAVLELFTSQGCSSCPAADAVLDKLATRKDVIALSLPVDYWDYLGWKDTLASPKFSARQKYYAKERGDGRVYTPQMVVSGLTHVVGSSLEAIDSAILATERKFAASRVPVKVRLENGRVVIETGDAPAHSTTREATIWLAMVRRKADVKIDRGENRGRTITYSNVVRELTPVGMWSGKSSVVELSRDAIVEPGHGNEACVVLIQAGKGGPIIGATMVDLL